MRAALAWDDPARASAVGHRNHRHHRNNRHDEWLISIHFRYIKAVCFGSTCNLGLFNHTEKYCLRNQMFMKFRDHASMRSFANMVELQGLFVNSIGYQCWNIYIFKDLKEGNLRWQKRHRLKSVPETCQLMTYDSGLSLYFTIPNQPRSCRSIWGSHHRSPQEIA